jgi:hypothetical protein
VDVVDSVHCILLKALGDHLSSDPRIILGGDFIMALAMMESNAMMSMSMRSLMGWIKERRVL